MKGLYLIKMQGGMPILPEDGEYNYNLGAYDGEWGLYEVAAATGDLNMLAASLNTIELIRRGEGDPGEEPPGYAELPIPGTARNRYNDWLEEYHPDWEQIGPGEKAGSAFEALAHKINGHSNFNFAGFYVTDV